MPPRRPIVVLVAAAMLASPSARGQEGPEAAPPRDLRPPVAAYTVLDGVRIPAPLDGLTGDAARGEALFADPEAGGCTACHAAPGHAPVTAAPRILRDRLPDLPPPEPEPEADAHAGLEPDALEGEPASDSDSALAPQRVSGPPPPRPSRQDEAASAAAAGPAAEPEPPRPPLLPLPPGGDLDGVADRLTQGQLRLWVVNPRIVRPGSRMPAYHDVSLRLAEGNPDLRQPWLSAQEAEDVIAYLMTLGGAEAPHDDVTPGDDPSR